MSDNLGDTVEEIDRAIVHVCASTWIDPEMRGLYIDVLLDKRLQVSSVQHDG